MNPEVQTSLHSVRLTQENVLSLVEKYDIVIDGSDNALTRYLVNDACVILQKPLVSGASVKWEGQVIVYNYLNGPCYRCLYKECPPASSMMSCSGSGVFGTAPGIVGMVCATECAKLIIGIGPCLVGKMLIMDLLNLRFKTVKVRGQQEKCMCHPFRNPEKTSCDLFDLKKFDYNSFIGTKCKYVPPDLKEEWEVEWKNLEKEISKEKDLSKLRVVDCRNKGHHGIIHVKEVSSVPVEHLSLQKIRELSFKEIREKYKNQNKVFIYCRSGRTSKEATQKMREAGVEAVNVIGGILKLMKIREFDADFIGSL